MSNERICERKECTGCEACINICPTKAIVSTTDKNGFVCVKIDEKKCLHCGKCSKVCPGLDKKQPMDINEITCYAGQALDAGILLNSSSGGLFSILASIVIDNGGVVCGAVMEPFHANVKHIIVNNKDDLKKLYGSKYVQSSLNDCYSSVLENLKKGRFVLFCGTPCQVSALQKYVYISDKQNLSNLITVDLVCHGVPSQRFYSDFIEYLNKKMNLDVAEFIFRTKEKGWNCGSVEIVEKSKKRQLYKSEDFYYTWYFFHGYTYRDSCYNCIKAGSKRVGDITLGDFWGIDKNKELFPEINNIENGVSLILLNTEKGRNLFNQIKNKISVKEADFSLAVKYNGQLSHPVDIHKQWRKMIFFVYRHWGASGVAAFCKLEKKFLGILKK